jgi:hypothetical protein
VHVVLPYVLPSFVVYRANASQDLAGETCLPDSEALPKILPLTARPPRDGAEEGDQGDSQRRADEELLSSLAAYGSVKEVAYAPDRDVGEVDEHDRREDSFDEAADARVGRWVVLGAACIIENVTRMPTPSTSPASGTA